MSHGSYLSPEARSPLPSVAESTSVTFHSFMSLYDSTLHILRKCIVFSYFHLLRPAFLHKKDVSSPWQNFLKNPYSLGPHWCVKYATQKLLPMLSGKCHKKREMSFSLNHCPRNETLVPLGGLCYSVKSPLVMDMIGSYCMYKKKSETNLHMFQKIK